MKRYGCIFTCMTTRAVHLKLAHSLSTDSFISALRRFVGRRGCVSRIYSDNGTNFVGADKELRKALEDWNQHRIAACLQQKEIDWHFNTLTASHFRGVWERLICSVRKVLGSIAGQAVFTDESLSTLLVEVENVLKSRPLTPVSFVDGSHKPLTPNDLLMVRLGSGLPPTRTSRSDSHYLNRWRNVQYYADVFWERWVKEYMPLLNPRPKWSSVRQNFALGDIVILVDKTTSRNKWPLGQVIKTFPDAKGLVCSVLVKTAHSELKRSISKLCLLVPSATS